MATPGTQSLSRYDGVALTMQEAMSGPFHPGSVDPREGAAAGKQQGTDLRFDVCIRIADLARFFRDPRHIAELSGTVSSTLFGGARPIRDGRFELFSTDPASGARRMVYRFLFDAGGATYCLHGHKEIVDDRAKLDLLEDMTRLYTVVYAGADETAPAYGAGELYFHLKDAPALVAAMRIEGARSWFIEVGARVAFASFAWGAVRDEYFQPVRLFYDTGYENLVLNGELRGAEGPGTPFFLVSGVHDKGFPWGDGELFWDVLLVVGAGSDRQRFCLTDRVLDGLELDVATGHYRYRGPLFRLREGYAASFSEMRKGAPALEPVEAEIAIDFDAAPCETVPLPFPLVKPLLRKLSSELSRQLREVLPGERPLGIHITPHLVKVRSGKLRLGRQDWEIPAGTSGECERGSFRNVKEPTLLYGYLCALENERARVQIAARTLRNERTDWAKDRLDAYLGSLVARSTATDMVLERDAFSLKRLETPLRKVGTPVLEVNNDHFPTAVFQRRVVEVEDPSTGRRCLALEEDMSTMRLEPIHSERAVTVASIRGDDKREALDAALDAAGFDAVIEEKRAAAGKPHAAFRVVIKPNFMFSYNKADRSTYTDPELVHHLVARLKARGFEQVQVVEAQCTYGEFFDHRGVADVASYLGYQEPVVDMTLDADEQRNLGPALGMHPVSRAWREADFRISFAKNKTHAYAFYTLTLKNIYGALPLANKFKEYHCDRDIYRTTMEYLQAFPVHFGIVDAWLSADGPFGVFADPCPNETRTILAGADLVAVDWVGASKMGIDPLVSKYMQLAVEQFGKPAIRLAGDASPYRPWLNVPAVVPLLAHGGMDAEYHFGNLLYAISAQMDHTYFHVKSNSPLIRLLRLATDPMRRTFFLRPGEPVSAMSRFFSRLFYKMGY